MFRTYRPIEQGEVIVVGADCSQGGMDENFAHFLSKTKLDIPLVYQKKGVAAEMTTHIYPVLEKIFSVTGIKPLVAFERNNGGASEMQRLQVLNREAKYDLFVMPKIGLETIPLTSPDTNKLGWSTDIASRPIMLGDLKTCIDSKLITIYDEETLKQLKTFIVNRNGKPEAARGKRDDAIMSLAVAWQLFQKHQTPISEMNQWDNINEGLNKKWRFGN